MSEDREHRRRTPRGGSDRWVMITGWVVALLLAANLAVGYLRKGEDGRPDALFSDKFLLAVCFWGPILALAAASGLGAWWMSQAIVRREKDLYRRLRTAFFFGLFSVVVLVAAAQDETVFKREWLAVVAALVSSVQVGLFAFAARSAVQHGAGPGRSRGSSDEDE